MLILALSLALGLAQVTEAGASAVPADPRLDAVRGSLTEKVERASAAGLPADLLVTKVREGLAKGVDPGRIDVAVGRLAESLGAAKSFVAERRPGAPPASLVRAVAEAKLAGVELDAVDPLLRQSRGEPETRRAIEVLTDLSRRGYPSDRALAVVNGVLSRDPGSLDRVPGTLETIRNDHALSRTEAVDALARGLTSTNSLQGAYSRTISDERGKGAGQTRDKTTESSSEGQTKSPLAPGHLPKVKPGNSGNMNTKMKKMK